MGKDLMSLKMFLVQIKKRIAELSDKAAQQQLSTAEKIELGTCISDLKLWESKQNIEEV